MVSTTIRALGGLAGLALLAACGQTEPLTTKSLAAKPTGIEAGRMVVQPAANKRRAEGNVVLSNVGALRDTLSAYANVSPGGRPSQIIDRIEAANRDPNVPSSDVPGLTGLGGIVGHAFLGLAKEALKTTGQFNPGARVVISLSGQIKKYAFDDATKGGSIEAVTYVTHSLVTPGGNVPQSETTAIEYTVRVDPGGFRVIDHSGDPNDPFPGTTLAFGPAMLERIESLDFQYKLWALGTAIHVTRVKIDREYQWGTPPDWDHDFVPGDTTEPGYDDYRRLFDTDAQSCIDMMFVDYPPDDLSELQAPPFYCLGRCANPLLINTR